MLLLSLDNILKNIKYVLEKYTRVRQGTTIWKIN